LSLYPQDCLSPLRRKKVTDAGPTPSPLAYGVHRTRTLNLIQPTVLIYSLGTSNRTPGEFLDLFTEHEIEVGVDIRSFPTSRFPHFTKQALQNLLESNGIHYEYLGKELGGFRKGGYLAYMKTDSFRIGLERLEEMGRRRRAAFFCSERFPWRCHRRWVARKLNERGWKIVHIIEKGRVWIPLLKSPPAVGRGSIERV